MEMLKSINQSISQSIKIQLQINELPSEATEDYQLHFGVKQDSSHQNAADNLRLVTVLTQRWICV